MNTEKKSASFYVAYLIKKLWALVALSLVVVAVSLSVLRYSLPYMNDQKHHLETWLSEQVGAELRIGEISAKWQGVGPAIVLRDVHLVQDTQSPISLEIAETAIEVDFWESVLARQIQSNKFDLHAMQLTLDLSSLRQDESDYPIVDALEKLFLQQLQLFSISDSKIILNTKTDQQIVLVDQVSWVNRDDHHQGVGKLQIEEIAKNSASFILDLYGSQENLNGTFFAEGNEVDLSPWLEQWISTQHKLVESRGSFVMWASIDKNALQSVQLDLSNSRFNWKAPDDILNKGPVYGRDIQASVLGGQISARPINNEWVFNLNNLTTQINDHVLVSNWAGKIDQTGTVLLQHDQPIKLAPLLSLLPLSMKQSDMQVFAELQPKATLNSLNLSSSLNGDLTVKASINDMQWQQTNFIPGMENISAEINWHNQHGKLSLKGKSGELSIDKLLPNDINYQRFYTDIYIKATEKDLSVTSVNSLFKSELFTIHPNFHYRSKDNYLALTSVIESVDIPVLQKLYPKELMGEETKAYLVESLLDGKVAGAEILWFGTPAQFPFEQNQGIFQASVDINEATLKFAPDWPALTELDIDLLFENESLYMNSQKGQLLDVKLANLHAEIPSLSEGAILTIDTKAKAIGPQVTELMMQSSIASTLGKTLQQIQIDGQLQTNLNLHIPLDDGDLIAKGDVLLTDNQMYIPSLDFLLEHSKGTINFVNDKIKAQELRGKLLDQAVNVSFTGEQNSSGYQTDIQMGGEWEVTPLLETYHPGLAKYLSGKSLWTAKVALTLPQKGYQYSAEIFSELIQLNSDLPAPFAKSKEQPLPLLLTSQGNQQASSVKITLGDDIEFNGNLPHKNMQFSRAHLAIGQADLVGMGLGFSISAKLPDLDTRPWFDAINIFVAGIPKSEKPLIDAPKRIFINIDNAVIASQKLTNLETIAKNTNDSWLLDINADQARMEVAFYKDWLNRGVNIKADFIELAKWHPQEENENLDKSNEYLDLTSLPPVSFSCVHCRYLENDLGKIDFKLSRSATGMRIDNLRLNNSYGLFYGSGDWFLAPESSSTRLKGEFSSSDFGAFLKGFNFDSGIKDSKAHSTFDLSWQNTPYEFNFDTLNGQIGWRLSDGYLTEVNDQGSRIFSLLSLDSLVRKLKLDFRDVFAKGFFYDKINGSFQIQNGVADTQDTVVDGGAGEITMKGYTDLTAQQLNYQIEFAPKVTSSLPVIVAYMVNPATALAALALDQVMTSAKVISNIKFSLTGTLEDPQLKELGRDSKEVSLPARAEPSLEAEPKPVNNELVEPISIQVPTERPISG